MTSTLTTIPNYNNLQLLHDSQRTIVYRGQRTVDAFPVVIKLLKQEYPTFRELVNFRMAYVIALNLDVPGVVKPLALDNYGLGFALVMPDFGGISLSDYITKQTISLSEFFRVAHALCGILDGLYRHRVIHKDIKPANILIHPETLEVKLIDFSIASLLPKETQVLQNPEVLEGTLAYMSPEQTGRMNRGIDYRSDFYSLGVTFYQLLTGQLPFPSSDPMELVHCHIARRPTPPQEVKPDIPQMLSSIVMKLMAKTAEDRYQTARGLRHDLEICYSRWVETGSITPFELATRDISDRFSIPEKLYGRATEVSSLLAAFDRVASGKSEMMLVAGYSGIGKTAVVNEVHKPIVRQRGYFIKGKFDQFQRNIPFSAFLQAFRDLMAQLLGETETALQQWQAQILSAVGAQGRVIIDVIPELERIIGPQPPVPALSGTAAQNRFKLLFGKFIGLFATPEHPLVIFIDDLQWADSASLKLIELLMSETETEYLLLIGAYRDNEVYGSHPLMLTLAEIGKTTATTNSITLGPLLRADINHLVADTLSCAPELAKPLTELVYQKTQGNPFFSNQFLKSLHGDGLIDFHFEVGHWQCDIVRVRELSLTDDVVEFMASRLALLPRPTQEVLKLAACIGNQFDLATLAIVYEQDISETAACLWKALQEGFILPTSEIYKFFTAVPVGLAPPTTPPTLQEGEAKESEIASYKFLHDRVQQAAYSLIEEDRKQQTHLSIGQLLLKDTPAEHLDQKIFDIVNQLNIGADIIVEQSERDRLVSLNLMAGRKAKSSIAYEPAVRYLSCGLQLLAEAAWTRCYELTFDLYIEAIEVQFLNVNLPEAKRLSESAIAKTQTLLDRVRVYELEILFDISQNQMLSAIDRGLKTLEMLDIVFPRSPELLSAEIERLRADVNLEVEQIPSLVNLPEISDAYKYAAIRILTNVSSAAYIANPVLCQALVLTTVKICLEYGHCPIAASAYSWYSSILCGAYQDLELGYEVGKLSMQLLSKFNAAALQAKVGNMFDVFVRPWQEAIAESIASLPRAIQGGFDNGDVEYAFYAAVHYCNYCFYGGQPLKDVQKLQKTYLEATTKAKYEFHAGFLRINQQTVVNLLGEGENKSELQGAYFDESKLLPVWRENEIVFLVLCTYEAKTRLAYLFGDYATAVAAGRTGKQYAQAAAGTLYSSELNFYYSLALLANCNASKDLNAQNILEEIAAHMKTLSFWADNSPSNFRHKEVLVEAEKARVLGQKMEAMELYDRAIAGAKENGYVQEEALANELAGKFYLEWGKEKIARTYMIDAYYCYSRWGAKAKVSDLEERYPQLLAAILKQETTRLSSCSTLAQMTLGTVTATSTGASALLDLSSAIKTSQALSGEINLERLLSKLMQVVMENAGASKSALLLEHEETLVIEAIADYSSDQPHIWVTDRGRSLRLDWREKLSVSIINTVWRTREPLVINDGIEKTRFASDLMGCQPQSVLCLPLGTSGKLIGILYLENHLATGVFTRERLSLLQLIASQAAISLENARLYHNLEKAKEQLEAYSHTLEGQVAARTQELNEKNVQLHDKNQRLGQTLSELQRTQAQMIHSEKMSSLGQMVAGIAHEINNPVSFIYGNVNHATDYFQDLLHLLDTYQQSYPNPTEKVSDAVEEIDLEFLVDDLEKLLKSMKFGAQRIRNIVLSLRNFSRLDEYNMKSVELHEGIESTLLIVQHSLDSAGIRVIKQYSQLPPVTCYASELNQVFLHLLNNAIDALHNSHSPQIIITTSVTGSDRVKISIADNGPGMSEEVRSRVFDPFFTTKPVGSGTGLGLSVSYQIVVEKHGGSLTCISAPGQGTEFIIEIPMGPKT